MEAGVRVGDVYALLIGTQRCPLSFIVVSLDNCNMLKPYCAFLWYLSPNMCLSEHAHSRTMNFPCFCHLKLSG